MTNAGNQNITESLAWHARAQQVIPGGVSSPVRAFKGVGGSPRYFVRGEGSHIWDVDGNEYVDLVGSWGPMILGHAHPAVVAAVRDAAARSASFGAPSPNEVLLAEEIIARVPGAERVRFVSSGTEAVMTAVRVARAAASARTGQQRNVIVKFAGCYHGHSDALLVQAGSGVVTLGLPNSPGVTPGAVADTVVLDYNDAAGLTDLFARRGHEIAAVITEPTPANMGVVPPLPVPGGAGSGHTGAGETATDFNGLIRRLTAEHGALMILDEVMTGFRIASGGWFTKFIQPQGWAPDLFTYGKVIGGGYPVAAVAGPAAIMDMLAPIGAVYQAGTLSGNPVATAAGLATLQFCDDDLYRTLDARAAQVGGVISEALTDAGVPFTLQTGGSLFSFFFTDSQDLPHKAVTTFAEAQTQNVAAFNAFFHAMLEGGVSLPPSAFEAWFVNGAMSDADIDKIGSVARVAAAAAAKVVR